MKLIRFGNPGEEKPGIVSKNGVWLDCSEFGEDWCEEFLGDSGLQRLARWLRTNQKKCPQVPAHTRLGPPTKRPSKLICVGLNYVTHATESQMDIPKEPVLFMKATSSIVGPNDDIIIPKNSQETDWEVELAVVIGKRCAYIKEGDAYDYVAGYTMLNDVSEREFQLRHGGQWVKGKSLDTFAPIGPYLVSSDEIEDPHNLRLWLKLNGDLVQDGNTSDLIFGISKLVSYISQYMTLLPGDIISTGTPSGVGMGFSPQRYLRKGDEVELGIDGLGVARQTVKAQSV